MRAPVPMLPLRLVALSATVLALTAGSASAAEPPAPAGLAVEVTGPTRATSTRATWTVPVGTPAGTTARWRACPDGGTCATGSSSEPGAATIDLPTEGRYVVGVRLVSGTGEEGPEATVDGPTVDRTAPGAPTDVRPSGGGLTWTDPPGQGTPIVRAHWRLCRGWGVPAAASTCASGVGAERPVPFSEEAAPLGPYPGGCVGSSTVVRLWLDDAAGNVDAQNAGGYDLSVSPSCPAPADRRNERQPTAPPAGPSPAPAPATRLTVTGRSGAQRRSGRRVVTVTAVLSRRDLAGRVTLRVAGAPGGPRYAASRKATVRRGRVAVRFVVPRGVRRLVVRAAFAPARGQDVAETRTTLRLPVGAR